ncbi:LysR family transcriptional regulator [Ensifer sp. 1H6]|uniref:LysR family transcriptional regulator n=1 Tax=Ensifer sp. 1H6 TaxID=1911585 RepID=UPI0009D45ADA|nr:hypothetical protein BKP54_31290 [Ensifer sp. 1H6]
MVSAHLPLKWLRAFEAAARLGSFAGAGAELNVSRPPSRSTSGLEAGSAGADDRRAIFRRGLTRRASDEEGGMP